MLLLYEKERVHLKNELSKICYSMKGEFNVRLCRAEEDFGRVLGVFAALISSRLISHGNAGVRKPI